eukprot:GHVU01194962.1.p1 GENE.GHVU01194962.1~~GHVU01194962.1.p1  ORF type:complete len:133 (-),score=12.00 GHVU01194962.1:324-674(-)
MADAAERMGQAASIAEKTGEVIRHYKHESNVYRGGVRNGPPIDPHGVGVLRHCGSVLYEGEWRYDRQHGLGVFRCPNYTYAGQWEDNLYHGFGVKRDSNGRVDHAGFWQRNQAIRE